MADAPLPLRVHATAWRPADVRVTLNVTLHAAVVPSAEPGGCRVDTAHVVVLDDLLDAASCDALLARLTGGAAGAAPPEALWARRTADAPSAPRTWGLTDAAMRALETHPPPAMVELQSRLAALYPECALEHLVAANAAPDAPAVCERFVANAAVHGDCFSWHVDAEAPAGEYVNRERGKPLLVSALLYLDADWPDDLDAETLFLDPPSGCGIFVRPKRGRLVLMDADVTHRVSAPSAHAGRPRFSLVWKARACDVTCRACVACADAAHTHAQLVFRPCSAEQRPCIARPEWGRPTAFGSAARVEALTRALPPRSAQPAAEAVAADAAASSAHAAAPPPARSKRAHEDAAAERPGAKRAETLQPRRGVKRGSSAELEEEALPLRKAPNVADAMEA
jgi:hypothetical protein